MPILLSGPGGSSAGATYTAQDIISGTSQDLRSQLPTNSPILLDYVDRIHKEIIRSSARWDFMLASPQQFITEPGITDYWIAATGTNPQGSIDTGLNLTDVHRIKDDTVFDRSDYTPIYRVNVKPPNLTTFQTPDGQSRLLRPTNFSHETYSGLLQIWPAPNNQNGYQPSPESPICTTVAGGALAARTYFVRYSLVDSAGLESDASAQATPIFIPANSLLKVKSPKFPGVNSARGIQYNQYKVYASITSGSEVVQNGGTAITSGTDFTESVGGLSTGTAAYPSVNNITKMDGYLIEFRYFKQRLKITSGATTLLVPDDYKDVLIAGVNWLGYQFLKLYSDSKMWLEVYQNGLREMVRDRNQFNNGDFLKPDAATQQYPPGIIPGFITGN